MEPLRADITPPDGIKYHQWENSGRAMRAHYQDGEIFIEGMGRPGFGDITGEKPGQWKLVAVVHGRAIAAVVSLLAIDSELRGDFDVRGALQRTGCDDL